MTDKNKEIRVRKLQVKKEVKLKKNLTTICFYLKIYQTHVSILNKVFFAKRDCHDPKLKSEMQSFLTFVELIKMFQDSNQAVYRALPSIVAQ